MAKAKVLKETYEAKLLFPEGCGERSANQNTFCVCVCGGGGRMGGERD